MSRKGLGEILKVGEAEVNDALARLKTNLENRGVVLLEKDNEIMLGTKPELSSLMEKLQKEELNRELSKASLETLSIILYKNGATRAEIDYIRGVNSSFILRVLAVRGLVEKITDAKDSRRYIYRPSFDLLQFMGVQEIKDLPEWTEIKNAIDTAAKNMEEEIKKEDEEARIADDMK